MTSFLDNYISVLGLKFRPLARLWSWLPALLLPVLGLAQTDDALFPPKPDPAVYVHDYAGWLSPDEKTRLEQKLRRYYDSTSTQIVVMIRPDLGGYDKASYAFELGNRWGIGRKSKNNGVVMLIKSEPPDRGIFIATGYGVEGALPDILAGRIIRNTMAPFFREKQWYAGIDAGLSDIIRALAGEFKAEPEKKTSPAVPLIVLLVIILLVIIIVYAVIKASKGTIYTNSGPLTRRDVHPADRGWGGGWWMGGGGWGGGSGGGGGWGGGGDSFGGGSFGGGGAGGDW